MVPSSLPAMGQAVVLQDKSKNIGGCDRSTASSRRSGRHLQAEQPSIKQGRSYSLVVTSSAMVEESSSMTMETSPDGTPCVTMDHHRRSAHHHSSHSRDPKPSKLPAIRYVTNERGFSIGTPLLEDGKSINR